MYANKLNKRHILVNSKGSADSELKKINKDQLYISEETREYPLLPVFV
jgi:hypothetical protein